MEFAPWVSDLRACPFGPERRFYPLGAMRPDTHQERWRRVLKYEGERGQVEMIEHHSDLLVGNPWADSPQRQVAVWTPPGYSDQKTEYPVVFYLAAFTSSGLKATNWDGFTENLPERLDRLVGTGQMEPAIVVMPDAFIQLGGNQYIDSPAVGPWASYLTQELVPWVDDNFRTLADRNHRGLFGFSSGGYGALVHGMMHSDVWGGVACHSGDLYFKYACLPDFPQAIDTLRRFNGDPDKFLNRLKGKVKYRGSDIMTLMTLALCAFYDPCEEDPRKLQLPFETETGELIEERWQRWLSWDPVEMVASHVSALKSLRYLYLDCGFRDQYRLHHGARIMSSRLKDHEIAHHYEEFDDDHSSIQYRYDHSLPALVKSLLP